MENKVITVTSPLLPSLDDFMPYLQDIWDRKWLTIQRSLSSGIGESMCAYLKCLTSAYLLTVHCH